jgi:hypothetical protein
MPEKKQDRDNEDWEFGDEWKKGSPDDPVPDRSADYVEVLRGDTGMGYDDTSLMEYVLFLGEHGIEATFDSYPLEQIKIYVLRVEAGREEEAKKLLREKMQGED